MTWVDAIVLAVLVVSALLAFLRGLVREALGIAAWIGAGYVAVRSFHAVEPYFRGWIPDVGIADPVAFGVVFLVCLIAFSIIAGMIGRLVRGSVLGGLDRTLGLVFGLLRGAVLVIAAYIIAQRVVPIERWPVPVLQARALPLTYEGAGWMLAQLPPAYRPRLEAPPGRTTSAEDLLHANPHGFALSGRAAAGPTRDLETR